jgi:hypothetical protein
MTTLAPTLGAFFTQRLIGQRRASPHTVAAYRDTFRLLLGFVHDTIGTPSSKLRLDGLDAPLMAHSCTTSNTSGASRRLPETPDWPRSAPSTGSPPSAIPSTRP